MVVLVGKELLMSKLEHLRVLVIDVVDFLISQVDGLIIFLHHKLRSLDFSLLVKVWDNQHFIECSLSDSLSKFGKKHLLSTHKLNLILLIVAELDAVLIKLKGTLGWVLLLEVLNKVLARHLILNNLRNWVAVSGEEALLLVENF